MSDQNRKTLRSFYCRDYLWDHFEQMAQELGCSMDYLINESMRQYARDKEEGAAEGAQPAREHRTFERVPAVGGGAEPAPRSPQQLAPGGGNMGGGPSPQGPPPPPPRPNTNNGTWSQAPTSKVQSPGQSRPPQPPGASGQASRSPASPRGQALIYLSFNNNRYIIDKPKYVIGRGSKQTDLTIRDGNISRKHCVIICRNGTYYIKDLDSTNGVEYRGNRIESKKIEEGDVFYLCDYELRFSYHG